MVEMGRRRHAWDSINYDPELGLIYIGTGNGGPDAQLYRSPAAATTCSCVPSSRWMRRPAHIAGTTRKCPKRTGTTPALQSIVQADLTIDGKPRKVLMHAPKNGFFYVIDRTNGQFISAKNHVPVTWTTGIDPVTGRPAMNPEAHYGDEPVLVAPGPGGGHNWFPMAYNPETGLAYFPQYEHWFVYALDPELRAQALPLEWRLGWLFRVTRSRSAWNCRRWSTQREKTALIAWDPVKQEVRWRVPLPRHGNGGVLTTAGNLRVRRHHQADLRGIPRH